MNNKVFKIYRSRRICIPAASLLVLASSFSCKEAMYESIPYSPQERGEAVSIGTPSDALWIKAGETLRPTLVLEYENGETVKVLASDIGWSVEDPSVAVGEAAGIKGLVPGTTMVKAAAGESSADFTLTVKDGKSTTGITAALTEEHIYSKGHYLDRNSVIQGFDITGKGDLYYMQIAGSDYHNLAVIRTKPNKGDYITDNSNVMYFKYFGHGTNFAVEEAAAGDYIWIGSYGSKNSSGEYWNSQTIARVKYEPGKTVTPDMVLGPERDGRKFTYITDTLYFPELADYLFLYSPVLRGFVDQSHSTTCYFSRRIMTGMYHRKEGGFSTM